MKNVSIGNFSIGEGEPLTLISGPCVIEDESLCLEVAEALKEICERLGISYVFKASYDKANRSSIDSFRGPGVEEGLRILEAVSKQFEVPVLTDVHTPEEAVAAAEVCDLLQIPAFLCRQTDLLVAAANSGRPVTVKKGQFMAPWEMVNVVEKIRAQGNEQVVLIDRGTTFGYNNLVCDMRGIPIMKEFGVPVCFDATHAVQLPGGQGSSSGGQREYISPLARAAVAAGANCLYIETHPNPEVAKSDPATQQPLKLMESMLEVLVQLYDVVNPVRR